MMIWRKISRFGRKSSLLPSRQCNVQLSASSLYQNFMNCVTNCFVICHFLQITTSKYLLFPNWEKWVAGKRFGSAKKIIVQDNIQFMDLNKLKKTLGQSIWYSKETMLGKRRFFVEKIVFYLENPGFFLHLMC